MTVVESISLMLGLLYAASLLYFSGKKWGAGLTVALTGAAVVAASAWPLLVGAAVAIAVLVGMKRWQPQLAQGEGRENQIRELVHHFFSLSILIVGMQYVLYHALLLNDMGGSLIRPDVVDAFLPIAGGIGIRSILTINVWDSHHPAAAVMLLTVVVSAIVCKRAFCGWACPLSLAGTYLYKLRKRFIAGDAVPPKWLDWPLRMLKYLLLIALVYIVFGMPAESLPYYLNGNYHKVADVKMGMFFLNPSLIAAIIIGIILVMAAWQQHAFCRYLCPYGAGLGLVSFLSPLKIRRDSKSCLIESRGMKCDKCSRACPARIQVHQQISIRSDECQACMRCVSACPKSAALGFSTRNNWRVSARGIAIIMLVVMFGIPLAAYAGGYWHSDVTDAIRLQLIPYLNSIGH
ncbi:4Fe-4S binding protein [Ferrimonas lipolytica]|uniref:4Fe-4S binding protein n=1 Tax=Ferrimonas lipolytica TaxID=2724191 RepID=A0A6H1UD53_9GAMM|nr:4Fe-4S binding protein [Ferrimonas lipolytica]QIZ75732.1 4Fe-4S binding protein [Ferrimonas lipolytica]